MLRAALMLTPAMLQRTLVVVGYPILADAAEHVSEIIDQWRPIGLEGLDEELIEEQQAQDMNVEDIDELPRDGPRAWLLVQFGADTKEESVGTARRFADWLTAEKGCAADRIKISESAQESGNSGDIWTIRESGLGSTAFARGEDNWPGWEDSAVPPDTLGKYMLDLRHLMNQFGLKGAMYGHLARAASTAGSASTCGTPTASPPTVRSWRRRPTWSPPSVGPCPVSTATASSAPNCWRSSTGARSSRRCASSSASGTRTGK